jgi:ATP-dependent Zn protease
MLVKAVAHHTSAAFIRVNGSEFVQKYLGEGPRMVRDVFRLARENAPAIIFIDEVDAIATKRFDAQTGADREVQRILIELLTQMDGFDQGSNVKVRAGWFRRSAGLSDGRRSSWPRTAQIRSTLRCSVRGVSTGRSSSRYRTGENGASSSRHARTR